MPTGAQTTFGAAALQPAMIPENAHALSVKLPNSVNYAKGTVLGEITGGEGGTREVATLTPTLTGAGPLTVGTATLTFISLATNTGVIGASAITFTVAVEADDDLTEFAAKVAAAFNATATLSPFYTASSSGDNILITSNLPQVNDTTLKLSTAAALNIAAVDSTVTTAGVAPAMGQLQVNRSTVTGSCTGGTCTVVVTAAGVTGSPVTVTLTLVNADSTTVCATKIAAALNANGPISALYTASSSAALVYLTAKTPAANDATLNINVSGAGLTTEATSVTTVAGAVAGAALSNFTACSATATDGSQVPKGILMYDCQTDASGNVTLSSTSGQAGDEFGQTFLTAPMWFKGTFRTEELNLGGTAPGAAGFNPVSAAIGGLLGRLHQGVWPEVEANLPVGTGLVSI